MDNSLEILNTLEGTVDRLKVIYSEGGEVPLNDNVAEVRQLCISVEEILRHQQKDKVSFWGDRRDYWNYLSEVVSKMKTLDGCVKRVQGIPQLTSGQGKGRALIRECLTEQLLAECIQNSLSNTKRTKEWYHPNSILLTESLSQRVLNALYDLSNVTFDLPFKDGLDLDETWPSFVLKSFQNQNGPSTENQNQSTTTTMSPIMKVLGGSTQVARIADRDRPKVSKLEHAVEEEPTEIFVRHEIPFNLELVGTLLSDIRDNLTSSSTQSDHSFLQPHKPLPQLQVTKMDDITSCLDLLKDYIVSWSHDLSKKGGKLVDENKSLRDKQADLEMQLQETILESESSETDLVEQLQSTREELKSYSSDMQRLTEENQQLTVELSQARDKLQELEVANFDLEEQLVRCSSSASEAEGEDKERQRAFTIMESSLQEKDQELVELSRRLAESEFEKEQLHRDLSDARTSLDNQRLVHEARQKSEESIEQLQSEVALRNEKEAELREELTEMQARNQTLVSEIDALRSSTEREIAQRLERESEKWALVEAERDCMKAELEEVSTLIEDSTSALKFKLSSQNIELQQVKEHCSKKDRTISELRNQLRNLESQLGEAAERCESVEQQVEELKCELQDVESVLQNNRDEMSSMHEQLTEKTVSRDQERESMLKSQLAWDSAQEQLLKEKANLKQQVEKLTCENDEIRRALQKLLEQKVTLWQHADDLEQEQIAMGTWLNAKDITECMNCNLTFTIFARKHHCRSCGKVFCTKCCEKRLQLAVSKDPSRVCDGCYKRILQKRMPFASSVINNMDASGGSPSLQRSGSNTPTHLAGGVSNSGPPAGGGSSNSLNIERTVDMSGNSLQAKLLVQNQESELDRESRSQSHSRNSPVVMAGLQGSGSSHSLTNTLQVPSKPVPAVTSPEDTDGDGGGVNIPQSSYRSVNSLEYSVDPETMRRENERVEPESGQEGGSVGGIVSDSDNNYCISSVQGETIDESYYLIETTPLGGGGENLEGEGAFPVGLNNPGSTSLDVNALASKLATLEGGVADQGVGVASERRFSVGSGSQVGCTEVTEVMMEGGGVHKVPVKVERYGTAIAWEFSTEPKGIAFGIWYRERKESSKEDEVLPLKRCVSHKATLTGEYCAQKKGVYILKFDNCHSKYSGRKLLYKVWTRPPS